MRERQRNPLWRTPPLAAHPTPSPEDRTDAQPQSAQTQSAQTQGLAPRPPLFRQEAVEFQQHDRQWGQVVPLEPLPVRLLVWFITATAAAIVAFLLTAQYARKETVPGYLAPEAGTARVFAPQPGVVSAVYVAQGQAVEKGQPLLRVAVSQVAASGKDVNAVMLDTLKHQQQALQRQIAAEEQRTESERARLTAGIQNLESQLSYLGAQVATQRARITVAEKLVATATLLATKGLMSGVEKSNREEALLQQKQSLSSLSEQVISRQREITEQRYTLAQLPTVMADKIQSLRNDLSGVEQRIAEIGGRQGYIVRAPISGRVASLQVSPGQAVDPQHAQLQILPADSTLQADLLIPARAIGFVAPGQDVRILYDAFPYQQYGTYHGRITSISQTMLTSADGTGPISLRDPAYRATVALDRPDVDANGRKVALQPDMLLRADIILDRRTLMQWIVSPVVSARIHFIFDRHLLDEAISTLRHTLDGILSSLQGIGFHR